MYVEDARPRDTGGWRKIHPDGGGWAGWGTGRSSNGKSKTETIKTFLLVDVFAMSDCYDVYKLLVVMNGIDNTVVPDSYPPKRLTTDQLFAS